MQEEDELILLDEVDYEENYSLGNEDESNPPKKKIIQLQNNSFNPTDFNFNQSRSAVTDLFTVNRR